MRTWVERIEMFIPSEILRIDGKNNGNYRGFYNALAETVDVDFAPLLKNVLGNTIFPATAEERFFQYIETNYNLPINFSNDPILKREFLKILPEIIRIRGTKPSFEILLKLLGFEEVTITERWNIGGFDSPLTLDDPTRRFDQSGRCTPCSLFSIQLCGDQPLTDELFQSIEDVLRFLTPINGKLEKLTYRGQDVDEMIYFKIEDTQLVLFEFGSSNPDTFYLQNGDLWVEQDSSGVYSIQNTYLLKDAGFVNAPQYITDALNEWELLYPNRGKCQIPRVREYNVNLTAGVQHTELHDLETDILLVKLIDPADNVFTDWVLGNVTDLAVSLTSNQNFTGKLLVIG